MEANEKKFLNDVCKQIRRDIIEAIGSAGNGHVGGSLSIVEVLSVLYYKQMNVDPKNPQMADRDRLVLSKGHAGPALYSTLAEKGFFPREMLKTLNKPGTNLPSHADMLRTPGIDMTAGSLGQGLSRCRRHGGCGQDRQEPRDHLCDSGRRRKPGRHDLGSGDVCQPEKAG